MAKAKTTKKKAAPAGNTMDTLWVQFTVNVVDHGLRRAFDEAVAGITNIVGPLKESEILGKFQAVFGMSAVPTTAKASNGAAAAAPAMKLKKGIKPCKVPGCGKPSKGPRFRFLCEDHRDMGKAKLTALLKGETQPVL